MFFFEMEQEFLRRSILETLIYADLFEYPLKEKEIFFWLISSGLFSWKEFKEELEQLKKRKQIFLQRGCLVLPGRKGLIKQRTRRRFWSKKKMRHIRRVLFFLKLAPFVKAIFLSGSLPMGNAREEEDIDLFLVTEKGRLWLARLLMVLGLDFMGIRRRPDDKKFRDKLCLNLFLDEESLSVPRSRRDLFMAHEVLQAKLLWQKGAIEQKFLDDNSWTAKYLARAYRERKKESTKSGDSFRERSLKKEKESFFWSWLERRAFNFQKKWMARRKTREKTAAKEAWFHPADVRARVMKEYKRRLGYFWKKAQIDDFLTGENK